MRSFYKHIVWFSIFTCVVVIVLFIIVQNAYKNRSWTLIKPATIAFIGDSHIEQSINDNTYNDIITFAQSGDNYLYTYSKLVKLLQDNSSIDTVVLGIDYHNIDITADEWYKSQSYINFKFPKVFPYMSLSEVKELTSFNPWGYLKAFSNLFSIQDLFDKENYMKQYGAFQGIDSTITMEAINAVVTSNYKEQLSSTQMRYLDKIAEICLSKKIELVILTSPVHSSAVKVKGLELAIDQYVKKHNLRYLNDRSLMLSNEYFSDRFHLNRKGADYFTQFVLKQLREK